MSAGKRTLQFEVPDALVERIDVEASRRIVGRRLLLAKLLEIGMEHLPPIPGETHE